MDKRESLFTANGAIPLISLRNQPGRHIAILIGMRNATALEIFELDQKFYSDELRYSYRKKVKQFHPDTNQNASTLDFQLFQKAYELLRNTNLRDRLGDKPLFPIRLLILSKNSAEATSRASFEAWG